MILHLVFEPLMTKTNLPITLSPSVYSGRSEALSVIPFSLMERAGGPY